MSLKTAKKYIKLANVELKKFKATGRNHYLLQASEKGWKASAEYLFYQAKKKFGYTRKELGRHRLMHDVSKRIGGNTRNIFRIGERLHSNFYHNFMEAYDVKEDIEYIRERLRR